MESEPNPYQSPRAPIKAENSERDYLWYNIGSVVLARIYSFILGPIIVLAAVVGLGEISFNWHGAKGEGEIGGRLSLAAVCLFFIVLGATYLWNAIAGIRLAYQHRGKRIQTR